MFRISWYVRNAPGALVSVKFLFYPVLYLFFVIIVFFFGIFLEDDVLLLLRRSFQV
jgi:hypothetical protein